jgi:hypothetical protein
LLEKRAASCIFEKSGKQMSENVAEIASMGQILNESATNGTLYDLENSLVDSIVKGSF